MGFYSLFQYTGNARRLEAVNVGVALMCPEANFLETRLLDEADIKDAVKTSPGDTARHTLLASSQAQTADAWLKMAKESGEVSTREALVSFSSRLCNEVSMTAPRRFIMDNPEQELEALFQKLVVRRPQTKKQREKPIKSYIYDVVQERGLLDHIQRNYALRLPMVNQDKSFPLMYRNGATSLVEAVSLKNPSPQKFLEQVLSLKALGDLVSQIGQDEEGKIVRMDLVFACEDPNNAQTLAEALRDHMRLIPKDKIGILLEDIAHAQVLPPEEIAVN